MLNAQETRALLDGMDVSTLVGLRDRASLGVLFYSFARVSAADWLRISPFMTAWEACACRRRAAVRPISSAVQVEARPHGSVSPFLVSVSAMEPLLSGKTATGWA